MFSLMKIFIVQCSVSHTVILVFRSWLESLRGRAAGDSKDTCSQFVDLFLKLDLYLCEIRKSYICLNPIEFVYFAQGTSRANQATYHFLEQNNFFMRTELLVVMDLISLRGMKKTWLVQNWCSPCSPGDQSTQVQVLHERIQRLVYFQKHQSYVKDPNYGVRSLFLFTQLVSSLPF